MSVKIALLLIVAVAACGQAPSPTPTPDPLSQAVCELVPVARQIALDLDTAVAAARRNDSDAMVKAASDARGHALEIQTGVLSALRGLNQPPSSPLVTGLSSVALFGDQGGFIFQDPEVVPDARALADFQGTLDQLEGVMATLTADLAEAGLAAC